MKFLVFLLALVNLLFYAFGAGYFGHPGNPDAGRIEQQILPERMRIVGRGETPPLPAKPEVQPESPPPPETPPANEGVPPVATDARPEKPERVEKVEKALVCLAWRQLTPADADRLSAMLGKRFGDFKLSRKTQAPESNGWWVYIAPQPSKAEAEKKANELRDLGVKDFFVVQDGANRFGISLGVFSNEKGGQDRLAELKAKGVRSALVAPRPGKENIVTLQARGPADDKLLLVAAASEAVPKAEAQACK